MISYYKIILYTLYTCSLLIDPTKAIDIEDKTREPTIYVFFALALTLPLVTVISKATSAVILPIKSLFTLLLALLVFGNSVELLYSRERREQLTISGIFDTDFMFYQIIYTIQFAFCSDTILVFKNLPNALIITFLLLPVMIVHGSLNQVIIGTFSLRSAWLHSLIFHFTQPHFLSVVFRNMDTYDQFRTLCECESFLNLHLLSFFVRMYIGVLEGANDISMKLLLVALRELSGGILLGFMCGKVFTIVVRYLKPELINAFIYTTFLLIMMHFLCGYVFISSASAFITVGFMLIDCRPYLIRSNELINIRLIDMFFSFFDFMIYVTTMIRISMWCYNELRLDLHYWLLNFFSSIVLKILCLLVVYQILKILGFAYRLNTLLLMAWANMNNTYSVLVLVHLHLFFEDKNAKALMPYLLLWQMISTIANQCILSFRVRGIQLAQTANSRYFIMNFMMRYLLEQRDSYMELLKNYRYLGDVNWQAVRGICVVLNPYLTKSKANEEQLEATIQHVTCPNCRKTTIINRNEQVTSEEDERETRKKIWKEMKGIIINYYENGLISADCKDLLVKAFDMYIEADSDVVVKLEKLNFYFRENNPKVEKVKRIYSKIMGYKPSDIIPPRNRCRLRCYKIVMHRGYTISVIILNVIALMTVPFNFIIQYFDTPSISYFLVFFLTFTFAMFTADLVLVVLAQSWIHVYQDGIKTYFRSFFNIVNFILLIFCFVELILVILLIMKIVGFMVVINFHFYRLCRIIVLMKYILPTLMDIIESHETFRVGIAYESAKALCDCYEEILVKMAENNEESPVKDAMKERIVEDWKTVCKIVASIQINQPHTAAIIKTRQMIMATTSHMIMALDNLKFSGIVDEIEHMQLLTMIKVDQANLRFLKSFSTNLQSVFFEQAIWMRSRDTNFLFNRALIKNYPAGSLLCDNGQTLPGVLIVTSGFLLSKYTWSEGAIENVDNFGEIPVVDLLETTVFGEDSYVDIIPGNTLGCLSYLTGRTYDCCTVAYRETKCFLIHNRFIRELIADETRDRINGIESRMWKYALLDMAKYMLETNLNYTLNQSFEFLSRAIVPDLSSYHIFAIKEITECVLLMYGRCYDYNTNYLFVAPCVIPRTTVKFKLLNPNEAIYVDNIVKFMIVPVASLITMKLRLVADNEVELVAKTLSKTDHIRRRPKKRK